MSSEQGNASAGAPEARPEARPLIATSGEPVRGSGLWRGSSTIAVVVSTFVVASAVTFAGCKSAPCDPGSHHGAKLRASESKHKPLGDGCYHVLLDLGSNMGVHSRFLWEPELYPHNDISHLYDEVFGPDRGKMPICSFAFEPDPAQEKRQKDLQKAYRAMGWQYTYVPVGVGDTNGNLTFYFNGDGHNEYWGFSSTWRSGSTSVNVPVIDFSKWYADNIQHRKIPEFKTDRPPRIMMKVDIEGMELKVFSKMLTAGELCEPYLIIMELHQWATIPPQFEVPGAKNDTAVMNVRLFNSLQDMLLMNNCKQLVQHDSEKYLHDGQPFPVP